MDRTDSLPTLWAEGRIAKTETLRAMRPSPFAAGQSCSDEQAGVMGQLGLRERLGPERNDGTALPLVLREPEDALALSSRYRLQPALLYRVSFCEVGRRRAQPPFAFRAEETPSEVLSRLGSSPINHRQFAGHVPS